MKLNNVLLNLVLIIFLFLFVQRSTYSQSSVGVTLQEVASSNNLWTGVAISIEGRIFVNYPRWSSETTFSVGEIKESGEILPYPNAEWNNWLPTSRVSSHFQCVQSVYIDQKNYLWILDTGNPFFHGVVDSSARLFKYDLTNNELIQTIIFDSIVAPQNSYLNDVRVDTELGFAYITDSNVGAIVIVNLNTCESKRLLNQHYSTLAEDIIVTVEGNPFPNKVHSDGIALTPDGNYLYYKALTGKKLFRIKTTYLRNSSDNLDVKDKVEFVAETYATDAIAFDSKANLYLSSIEYNAIHVLDSRGNLKLLIQDEQLKWPDSFSITPDDIVYVTTSQLHLGFNPPQPYKIFRLVNE